MNIFPYSNFHELNLDWIIQIIKNQEVQLSNFVALNTIKYADPLHWDITRQYAQNTLVIDPKTGTAYLSVSPVPVGTHIVNSKYWTAVFTLQNFTEALKKAVSAFPQQEDGQAATRNIPAHTVFWVGDKLVRNDSDIPVKSLVIVGSNCKQIDTVSLIREVYKAPIAAYNTANTSITLGFMNVPIAEEG